MIDLILILIGIGTQTSPPGQRNRTLTRLTADGMLAPRRRWRLALQK
jgi:hypothetical protein